MEIDMKYNTVLISIRAFIFWSCMKEGIMRIARNVPGGSSVLAPAHPPLGGSSFGVPEVSKC